MNIVFYIGKDDINSKDLKNFITSHVHLRFLGLVHSDACYDESFIDSTHEDYRPELVVSSYNIEINATILSLCITFIYVKNKRNWCAII